ncbi:MAG TPA: M1 family metallopeptidase [Dehalococcoidia bacterium]|nr:M1 family metallopeptidase [Dehalococcoidia bacterium]
MALLAFVLVPVSPAAAAPRVGVPYYRIELDVDYAAGTYVAKQTVTATNQTDAAWDEITFAVTPARLGTFRLTSSLVRAEPVAATLTGSVLRLPASPAVAPGQTVTIELAYEVTVPDLVGRFGYSTGILSLGSFYPALNVYRQGPLTSAGQPAGWTAHQYVGVGDAFFTEAADYDVTIRLAQPATVAATGALVEQSGATWRYQAERIREFAVSVSDQFRVESIRVGPTVVAAYYLPEHAAAGTKYLHIARESLEWFTEVFGEYPYPQLSIVEMAGDTSENVGQEYPGLILMSGAVWPQTTDFGDYLTYLLAHEIAHQWFYGIVGNDQLEEPWVDEAIVTWLGKHWQLRVALDGQADFLVAPTRPIDAGVYEFPGAGPYFNVVYREGSSLIEEVYQALGDRGFFWALRDYLSTYRDQVATPAGFTDFLQSYTPRNLNPIYAKYLANPKYRTDEPLRAGFWTAPVWSRPAPIVFTSSSQLSRITLYADNRPIWSGTSAGEIVFDPRDLTAGDHLLTAVVEDESGRWVERSRRITVADPARPPDQTGADVIRPVGRFGA